MATTTTSAIDADEHRAQPVGVRRRCRSSGPAAIARGPGLAPELSLNETLSIGRVACVRRNQRNSSRLAAESARCVKGTRLATNPQRAGTCARLGHEGGHRDAGLFILGYAATVGFVASGIAASFYQLVTAEPARSRCWARARWRRLTTFLLCALTGPIIIMRAGDHGAATGRRSRSAGSSAACSWRSCGAAARASSVLRLRACRCAADFPAASGRCR